MRAIDKKHKRILYFAPMETEFQHHGVLGQRWGVITKNTGVNYVPKGGKQMVGASRKHFIDPVSEAKYSKLHKAKTTATTVGGAIAAGCTAAAGATVNPIFYALSLGACAAVATITFENSKSKSEIKKDDVRRSTLKTDPETGFYIKKKSDNLIERDLELVNPGRTAVQEEFNCPACAVAYDMRRRGYDVRAKQIHSGVESPSQLLNAYTGGRMKKAYKYKEGIELSNAMFCENVDCVDNTLSAIRKEPPNSRGMLCLGFIGSAGHVINYEVGSSGKPIFLDGQLGKKYSDAEIGALLSSCDQTYIIRTDNLSINPEMMKEGIE